MEKRKFNRQHDYPAEHKHTLTELVRITGLQYLDKIYKEGKKLWNPKNTGLKEYYAYEHVYKHINKEEWTLIMPVDPEPWTMIPHSISTLEKEECNSYTQPKNKY